MTSESQKILSSHIVGTEDSKYTYQLRCRLCSHALYCIVGIILHSYIVDCVVANENHSQVGYVRDDVGTYSAYLKVIHRLLSYPQDCNIHASEASELCTGFESYIRPVAVDNYH